MINLKKHTMKRYLLTAVTILIASIAFSQTPAPAPTKSDSLEIYAGKYKFPEGTVITDLELKLENGTLMGYSDQGNSEFKKVDGDVFAVVAYEGKATFRRNPEGKIVGIKIEVQDMILEGTKSEAPAVNYNSEKAYANSRLTK